MVYWPSTLPGLTKTWSVYKLLSESVYICIHLIVTCLRVLGPFQREAILSMDFMGALRTYGAITTQKLELRYDLSKMYKERFRQVYFRVYINAAYIAI